VDARAVVPQRNCLNRATPILSWTNVHHTWSQRISSSQLKNWRRSWVQIRWTITLPDVNYDGLGMSVVCLLIVFPGARYLHGSPPQDAEVPQRWPMAERWKKLWRFLTLTPQIGPSLLLIARIAGMQWSNDDSFGAVLEDNVSHTYGIHPCTPSLLVLIYIYISLFPFSFSWFWWVMEPMLVLV